MVYIVKTYTITYICSYPYIHIQYYWIHDIHLKHYAINYCIFLLSSWQYQLMVNNYDYSSPNFGMGLLDSMNPTGVPHVTSDTLHDVLQPVMFLVEASRQCQESWCSSHWHNGDIINHIILQVSWGDWPDVTCHEDVTLVKLKTL